jgi:formate/nitrite transporter
MLKAGAPIGLEKFVFGAVFPVGLIIVVIAGSELFTGNVMFMTLGVLDGSADIVGLAKNWVISWIFNFVGALFVAYVLAFMGGITPVDTAAPAYAISAKAIAVAEGKVTMPFLTAVIKAIGCNWLVCLAVWLANASDDVIGKILGIWFPIMAFVTIGFEHSVANMFFIPLGMFLGAEGVNWGTIIINNLIPVTIGNIIGGGLFVACIYWYTFLKE